MLTLDITLPAGLKLINANRRDHYIVKARMTAALRSAAAEAASGQLGRFTGLGTVEPPTEPLMEYAHVTGFLHAPSRRRMDAANWYPSFKAALDGLTDACLWEDDDSSRVVGPDMRLGPVVKGGQIRLLIREVSAEEHAALQAGELMTDVFARRS